MHLSSEAIFKIFTNHLHLHQSESRHKVKWYLKLSWSITILNEAKGIRYSNGLKQWTLTNKHENIAIF